MYSSKNFFPNQHIQKVTLFTIVKIREGGGVNGYDATVVASEGIDESNEKYITFRKTYRKRFGENPTIYAVNGYDAVMLLATLIGRVGLNPENVKIALYGLSNYLGAGGELHFDSNGDAIKKVNFFIVHKGKFIDYAEKSPF
ncbi:MAG: hypothetical protein C4B58_03305 [Deltaproteobacteria bacterium]|nr:MAG: hypothetical protein C4B58_03305 [Deltaproteobacteria bacterium]